MKRKRTRFPLLQVQVRRRPLVIRGERPQTLSPSRARSRAPLPWGEPRQWPSGCCWRGRARRCWKRRWKTRGKAMKRRVLCRRRPCLRRSPAARGSRLEQRRQVRCCFCCLFVCLLLSLFVVVLLSGSEGLLSLPRLPSKGGEGRGARGQWRQQEELLCLFFFAVGVVHGFFRDLDGVRGVSGRQ